MPYADVAATPLMAAITARHTLMRLCSYAYFFFDMLFDADAAVA